MLDLLIEHPAHGLPDLLQLEAALQLALHLLAELALGALLEVEVVDALEQGEADLVDAGEDAHGHALRGGERTWKVALTSWIMLFT